MLCTGKAVMSLRFSMQPHIQIQIMSLHQLILVIVLIHQHLNIIHLLPLMTAHLFLREEVKAFAKISLKAHLRLTVIQKQK